MRLKKKQAAHSACAVDSSTSDSPNNMSTTPEIIGLRT